MRFRIPNRDIDVIIDKTGPLSWTMGLNDDVETVHIHPVVPAVATAAATAAAFTAATTVGVPAVAAAACCAAVKPLVDVDGYYRQDGTYVRGHNRTWPDCTEANNFS